MVLIIVLSLLLISVSSAKDESLILGQYNISISFDSNFTTLAYSVNHTSLKGGTYGGTGYLTNTTWLNSTSNFALITVAHFNNTMCEDPDNTESSVNDFLQELKYSSIKIYNMPIDGQKNGILGVGVNSNGDSMFAAQYWQKSSKYFDTPSDINVLIESNYPWDDGTFRLLQSIRVTCKGLNS